MASILKNLRLLTDPSRLRILMLVEREELSVAELQEILAMGQSRISTHLAQLKQAGLVEDRRNGKSSLYRLNGAGSKSFAELMKVVRQAATEIPESRHDSQALRLVLQRPQDQYRAQFPELAGKVGRPHASGGSSKGQGENALALKDAVGNSDLRS